MKVIGHSLAMQDVSSGPDPSKPCLHFTSENPTTSSAGRRGFGNKLVCCLSHPPCVLSGLVSCVVFLGVSAWQQSTYVRVHSSTGTCVLRKGMDIARYKRKTPRPRSSCYCPARNYQMKLQQFLVYRPNRRGRLCLGCCQPCLKVHTEAWMQQPRESGPVTHPDSKAVLVYSWSSDTIT